MGKRMIQYPVTSPQYLADLHALIARPRCHIRVASSSTWDVHSGVTGGQEPETAMPSSPPDR